MRWKSACPINPNASARARSKAWPARKSANNAAVAGSLIPVLSLGIPGNPVTALLLGALVIQGIQPGPLFMTQRPDLFWGIVASMYVGNVFLLLLNLPLVGLWAQLLRVPYRVLFPIVLLLSVVGTYSANKNVFDSVGHARLRHCRLCPEQTGIRSCAIRHRFRACAVAGAIAAPVFGDVARRRYDLRPTPGVRR